jgi:hypothetical protein
VEGSCEDGNEPSGSMKSEGSCEEGNELSGSNLCWEVLE